jgi:hypothetical protein
VILNIGFSFNKFDDWQVLLMDDSRGPQNCRNQCICSHFKDQFPVHDGFATKIVVCIDIGLQQPFADLKYDIKEEERHDSALLQYMKTNDIVVITDKFNKQNIISVGFFLFVNPDIIFRDAFRDTITEALNNIDMTNNDIMNLINNSPNKSIPTFEVSYGSASYKPDKRKSVSTKVLDIQCAENEAEVLKELLCYIDFSIYFKKIIFIPRGLIQLQSDPMAYKKYIDCHRDYINHTTQFAITGLHPNAMFYDIETEDGSTYTPYSILLQNEAIDAIIPTATTNSKGTWLIVSEKKKLREATIFFDQEIDIIYQHIPDDPHLQFEDVIPVRIQKQRFATSMFMVSHSEFLDKLIPNTIEIPLQNAKNTGNSTINHPTIKRKATPTHGNTIQKQKVSHWQSIGQSSQGNSNATLITTTTRAEDIEEKMLQHVNTLEAKLQNVTNQMDLIQANNDILNQKLDKKLQEVTLTLQESDKKHHTALQQLKSEIKIDVSQQIVSGFKNQTHEMQELNRRFDFLCQHLGTTTITENPTQLHMADAHEQKSQGTASEEKTQSVLQSLSTVEPKLATQNDLVDTPMQTAIRKPAYATPVNKWYQPKKTSKTKHKIGKKYKTKPIKLINNLLISSPH